MRVSFDEHGRPDAEGSADWAAGRDVVVPDDIRELEGDIRAYHRERRAASRRVLCRRVLFRTRFGVTLPVVLGALVLAAIYSIVMLVVTSPKAQPPRSMALARPSVPAGRLGGLLPDLSVRDRAGHAGRLRSLRPAVLLLTPTRCDCATAARSAASAAEHNQLKLTMVGITVPNRPAGVSASLADLRSEPSGDLLKAYHVGSTPTVVLVKADGVVKRVFTAVPSGATFDSRVRALMSESRG